MAGWQVFIIAAAPSLGVIALVCLLPNQIPAGRSVGEIQQRVRRERNTGDGPAVSTHSADYSHAAPDHQLSILEAQRTMQRHLDCRVGDCPRKTAAWRTLVNVGRIKPDSARPQ